MKNSNTLKKRDLILKVIYFSAQHPKKLKLQKETINQQNNISNKLQYKV